MNKLLTILALTLSGLLFCATSQASSINFEIGDNSSAAVSGTGFWIGTLPQVTLSPDLAGRLFSLAPGASTSFDFFDITFADCFFCGGIADITASLDFLTPSASATGEGTGIGGSVWIPVVGRVTAGSLTWNPQPGLISTSLGDFSVYFDNLLGVAFGAPITVQATVTAISAIPAVPLPAAAWLFGSALLGFAGLRSRKRGIVKPGVALA